MADTEDSGVLPSHSPTQDTRRRGDRRAQSVLGHVRVESLLSDQELAGPIPRKLTVDLNGVPVPLPIPERHHGGRDTVPPVPEREVIRRANNFDVHEYGFIAFVIFATRHYVLPWKC